MNTGEAFVGLDCHVLRGVRRRRVHDSDCCAATVVPDARAQAVLGDTPAHPILLWTDHYRNRCKLGHWHRRDDVRADRYKMVSQRGA